MVPAFNPTSCPHLAVPAEVMQHVIQAESGGNRFAIGVVGGRLERQPRDLGEAVATARMLEAKGYDFSLGIAQINRSNLPRYGLDTFEQAFDTCANLTAGARILAECHSRSGNDWGKALSCYYSGNFTAGYRDGYVQRIVASLGTRLPADSETIIVHPLATGHPGRTGSSAARAALPGSAAYRVSIRSIAIDTAAGALVSTAGTPSPADRPDSRFPAPPEPVEAGASPFVPRVSGPGDSSPKDAAPADSAGGEQGASDHETADAAFVF